MSIARRRPPGSGTDGERQALDECRRSLDILVAHLGEDSPNLIDARECVAEALLGTGDIRAAREVLKRSVEAIADRDTGPHWTSGARFQLARALWATPADRPRALELARTTLRSLSAAEGDNRKLVARIERWLSTREERPRSDRTDVPASSSE